VLTGDNGSGELAAANVASSVGNLITHQGLMFDSAKGSQQNRWREYEHYMGRFLRRDPLAYIDGLNQYLYTQASPVGMSDSFGLAATGCLDCESYYGPCPLGYYYEGSPPACVCGSICEKACSPGGQCSEDYGCVMCDSSGRKIPCTCERFGSHEGPYPGPDDPQPCNSPRSVEDCIICHEQTHIVSEPDVDCSGCSNPSGCRPRIGDRDPETEQAYECHALYNTMACLRRVNCHGDTTCETQKADAIMATQQIMLAWNCP